jgi:hypothetical protein
MAETIRARYGGTVALATHARTVRPRLWWAGYGGAAWAALAALGHVHAGLVAGPGGGAGTQFFWRTGHWTAAVVLGLVAVHTLALVHPWGRVLPGWLPGVGGRRVPSGLLILPAFATSALALAYGTGWVLRVVAGPGVGLPDGLSRFERGSLNVMAWLMPGPDVVWALGLGTLVAAAAASYLGTRAARRIWVVVIALAVLRLLLAIDPLG